MTQKSEEPVSDFGRIERETDSVFRRHTFRELATAAAITIAAFCVLMSFSVARSRSELADFAAHWTACRLFRSNPFDIAAVTRIQDHLAAHMANLQIMVNPPWTALLFFPFAALPYAYATALWMVTSVIILWFVAIYFWHALGQKDNTIALAITFAFAPTIALLSIAQIDAVLLAAIVIFLIGAQRQNWILAGAALALFSVKPHLMILPALAIVLWSLRRRNWRLLLGGTSILGAMILAALILNRDIYSQWLQFVSGYVAYGESQPTMPNILGMLHPYLRFAPLLCGGVFVLYRFFRVPDPDWKFELPLMTAVGLATSFYGYYHDQVLALPLLYYAHANGNRKIFWTLFCIADALLFVHLEVFPKAPTWYYFPVWTASAWLVISVASLAFTNLNWARPANLKVPDSPEATARVFKESNVTGPGSSKIGSRLPASARRLLGVTITAMILIQIASLNIHWEDVTAKKPDFAALYGTAALIHSGVKPNYNSADIKGIDVGLDSNPAQAAEIPAVKTDSLHPPFESVLFLPLTFLSYTHAYVVWFACNLILLWSVPLILWPNIRSLHTDFHFIAILIGSLLPVSVCLIFGQDSILLLVLLSASYVLLERRHEWWAGVFLGLGLFKFQLILPIVAVFLIARAWKLIAGFIAALALLMSVSFAVIGIRATLSYFPFVFAFGRHISRNASERTALMPNLRGLVSLATASAGPMEVGIILAISAIIFIVVLRWNIANSSVTLSVRFAALVIMSSLVSYHYYVYNATILILPVLLFANELASSRVNSRFKLAFAITAISMYIVPVLFSLQIGMPVMAFASIALLILLLAYPGRTPEVLDLSKSSSAVTGSAF